MDQNPYKRVNLVECGATMADHTGSLVGNTCFFNSLRAGLQQMGHPRAGINYSDFLALGGWSRSFAGHMVDTGLHDANIGRLASELGIKIGLYTELRPGVTNYTIRNMYGSAGPEICIIRLRGFSHFNLMKWVQDQAALDEERRRAALDAQAAADAKYARDLAEKERLRVEAREARIAAERAAAENAAAAAALKAKWDAEDAEAAKQVENDAALARKLQEAEVSALAARFERL
jgi:hypothetical protein